MLDSMLDSIRLDMRRSAWVEPRHLDAIKRESPLLVKCAELNETVLNQTRSIYVRERERERERERVQYNLHFAVTYIFP